MKLQGTEVYNDEQHKANEKYEINQHNHQLEILKNFFSYKNIENTKVLQIFHVAGAANIAFFSLQFDNILKFKDILTPFLVISPFILSFTALLLAYFSLYITDAANFFTSEIDLRICFQKTQEVELRQANLTLTHHIERNKSNLKKCQRITIIGQWLCLLFACLTYCLFLAGLTLLALPHSLHILSNSPSLEIQVLYLWLVSSFLIFSGLIFLFSKISNGTIE